MIGIPSIINLCDYLHPCVTKKNSNFYFFFLVQRVVERTQLRHFRRRQVHSDGVWRQKGHRLRGDLLEENRPHLDGSGKIVITNV